MADPPPANHVRRGAVPLSLQGDFNWNRIGITMRQGTGLPSWRAGAKSARRTASRAAWSSAECPEVASTPALVTAPDASTVAVTFTTPSRPERRALRGYFGRISARGRGRKSRAAEVERRPARRSRRPRAPGRGRPGPPPTVAARCPASAETALVTDCSRGERVSASASRHAGWFRGGNQLRSAARSGSKCPRAPPPRAPARRRRGLQGHVCFRGPARRRPRGSLCHRLPPLRGGYAVARSSSTVGIVGSSLSAARGTSRTTA